MEGRSEMYPTQLLEGACTYGLSVHREYRFTEDFALDDERWMHTFIRLSSAAGSWREQLDGLSAPPGYPEKYELAATLERLEESQRIMVEADGLPDDYLGVQTEVGDHLKTILLLARDRDEIEVGPQCASLYSQYESSPKTCPEELPEGQAFSELSKECVRRLAYASYQ